ncbi:MAG: divergent polysaccharide deacetylase family protein [Rhodospirillales bacterium]
MGLLDRFKRKGSEADDEAEDEDGFNWSQDEGAAETEGGENTAAAPAAAAAAEDEGGGDGEEADEDGGEEEDGDEEEDADDFDFDDDNEDEDEDDDDEDDESARGVFAALGRIIPPGPPRLIAVAAGVFVVFGSLTAVIAGLFIGGDEDAPQAMADRPGVVSMALPLGGGLTSSGGGLNAFGVGAGSETAAAGAAVGIGTGAGMAATAAMTAGASAFGAVQNPAADSAALPALNPASGPVSGVPNPDETEIELDGLNAFAVPGGQTQRSGTDVVVNVTSEDAFAVVPDGNSGPGLKAQLDEALLESVQGGVMVPKIDGRRSALTAYTRPANPPAGQPRVAIVVVGLGHSKTAAAAAIEKLPPELSLSFDVYAPNLQSWVKQAWASGHEVLISLPMESERFPNEDAGPLALRTDISVTDNIKMLNSIMSRARGYIGMRTVMGSAFMADEERTRAVLETIKQRGVMILESTRDPRSLVPRLAAEMGVPRAFTNVMIDVNPSRAAVDQRLADLEAIARQRGAAVGVTHALPAVLERVSLWAQGAKERGLTLIPVSIIANRGAGKT